MYYPFDILNQMFHQDQHINIFRLTNISLSGKTGKNNDPTTPSDLLKSIYLLIMTTCVQFRNNCFLLNTHCRGNYLKSPWVLQTGMVHNSFELI